MSDLEEENRDCSDWLKTAEWSEDQTGIYPDCTADVLCHAKRLYNAVQIPGELNTRVRAAIESDRKRRKRSSLRFAGAGVAAIIGACYIMSQMGVLSDQRTEFTDPSRNMTAYPETKEDVTVIQTSSEAETVVEKETLLQEAETEESSSEEEAKMETEDSTKTKVRAESERWSKQTE